MAYAGSDFDHLDFDHTIADLRRLGDGRSRRQAFYLHLALAPLCLPVEFVSDAMSSEARAYTSRTAYEVGPDSLYPMLEMPAKDLLLHLARAGSQMLSVAAAPLPSRAEPTSSDHLHWAYVPGDDIASLAEGRLPDAASAWQVPLDLIEESARTAARLPGLGALCLNRIGGYAARELRLTAFFHPDFGFAHQDDALHALSLYVRNVIDGAQAVTIAQASTSHFYEDPDAFRRILYCSAQHLSF